ncbi:MAG: outer membrane beta-barrel protein [Nitrospiraceae bacterium]
MSIRSHMTRLMTCAFAALLIVMAVVGLLTAATAQAETYLAGQLGATLPSIGKGLTNIDEIDHTGTIPAGSTISNLSLKPSLMYGAKVGHYFQQLRWLGVEFEIYNSQPHLKQQRSTITIPGSGSFPGTTDGAYLRVLTIAPLNVMFRYPGTRVQPYVGFGPGIFLARQKEAQLGETLSSTTVGLNAMAGLRVLLTKHVALFGEWKYNYTRMSYAQNVNFIQPFGLKADYHMNHIAFGMAYLF